MSNPSKDPEFNAALQKVLKAAPKQNKNIKAPAKPPAKVKKEPKPWPWQKR